MRYRRLRLLRILSQFIFTALLVALFCLPQDMYASDSKAKLYFITDPLHYLISVITTHQLISLFTYALIPLILTLVLGRFFCGWICPMGALQHFASYLTRSFRKKNSKPVSKTSLSIKYIILLIFVLLSIMGVNLAGWLDPVSLLTRSLAALHHPLILAMLLGILLLTIRHHRFFCRVLCPLGALYALFARFRILKWVREQSCSNCQQCNQACEAGIRLPEESASSECLLCMNCASHCANNSLQLRLDVKRMNTEQEYLPKRRVVVTTLLTSTALTLLPKVTLASNLKVRNTMVRPPGALPESDFLDRCLRCGQCMQSCPTGFIQAAGIERGISSVWTPVCTGETGGCQWDCIRCGSVCPDSAIKKLSLEEKQRLKIGTAILNKNLCYTYAEGFNCTACYEACPLPSKAIGFRQTETINFRGEIASVNQAYVLTDDCTGCGLCVKACPRQDHSAIMITPEGESRRNPGF